jgi:hypothetical protein
MGNRIGQRLGNYRLSRLLGQGNFADVYLGEHLHLDTHLEPGLKLFQFQNLRQSLIEQRKSG